MNEQAGGEFFTTGFFMFIISVMSYFCRKYF